VWEQVPNIFFVAGEEIIKAYYFVALFDQSIAEVAAEKSGSSCY
jgi:hypothetical protein